MIVVGTVYTSEYEDRDGVRRSSLEMRATSVGPDLSRTIVRIEKSRYTGADEAGNADEAAAEQANDPVSAGDDPSAVDAEPAEIEATVGRKALPLSA